MVMYKVLPDLQARGGCATSCQNRGVNVRILLSRQIFGEPVNNHNLANRKTLLKLGLNTQLSRPEFSYSHEKTYIRDAGTKDALAFVADFNVDTSYFEFAADPADANPNELGTRGIITLVTDAADVADIAATFDAPIGRRTGCGRQQCVQTSCGRPAIRASSRPATQLRR